jgi:hypothetical protein
MQKHGGTTVGDPWVDFVTHALVLPPRGMQRNYEHEINPPQHRVHPDH